MLRVTGYREFVRACTRAEKRTRKEVRKALREVGDIVKVDARSRFSRYDEGSAAGFRTVVRQRGVSVEQSKRRVTGKRGDYGALQMRRGLEPAGDENKAEIEREMEHALDRIADSF